VTRHWLLRAAGTASAAHARRPAGGGPAARRASGRRLATIGAAAVLATMLTALSHQYAKTYTLAREKARLEQHRRDLIADNARLREEIERLHTDDRYIEEIARSQLGLVRPGEIELLVVPYDGTVSAPGGTASSPMARPDQDPVPRLDGVDGGGAGAAAARPHRGIGAWAVAVRDAVWRLLRPPRR
jgi:cell division protein FtsL